MTQPDVNIESEPRTSDGAGDIVVGVDGSEESFTALQWALREASLSGRAVNAVYAWTHSWDMASRRRNCRTCSTATIAPARMPARPVPGWGFPSPRPFCSSMISPLG